MKCLFAGGAALTLLVLAGQVRAEAAARTPEKALPLPGQVFQVEGRTVFVTLPAPGQTNRPTPWVWYAPTLPGLPGARERWMFERFLAAGIAIAGADVSESYGNPQGRAPYSAFYQELVERRGFARKPCLLPRSRGGLMLYNWACEHPESVACIAGIYPVCNLRSFPGLNRACGAYGLRAAQLEAQLTQHNPIDRLAALAKAGVPIFTILDLSGAMDSAGLLTWDVPPGQWVVVRFVLTNTGQKLEVPSPDSNGLIIDHLYERAAEHHFCHIMDAILKTRPSFDALRYMEVDSVEVAAGTDWTESFVAEFRRRRGYDPTPYLPALGGRSFVDPPIAPRFLYDYRNSAFRHPQPLNGE